MKLGFLTVPYASKTLRETIEIVRPLGVEALELGAGGYTNDAHCKVKELLANRAGIKEMKDLVNSYGMTISALSCHGNPVHPVKEIAQAADRNFNEVLEVAELLGVDTVVCFSGCPGGCREDRTPNWVTCAWPAEYQSVKKYQWEECLLPYWEDAGKRAQNRGVRVAIEMHPGFSVYNTETMLRLHEVSDAVGANFDPSHLFWQGVDAAEAIRELGSIIYYVHAKDCQINQGNTARAGVLDTKLLDNVRDRAWVFRTIGYGHDAKTWKDIVSALQEIGYDKTLSIEHEDALMSVDEGVRKAAAFLKDIIIKEEACEAWWLA